MLIFCEGKNGNQYCPCKIGESKLSFTLSHTMILSYLSSKTFECYLKLVSSSSVYYCELNKTNSLKKRDNLTWLINSLMKSTDESKMRINGGCSSVRFYADAVFICFPSTQISIKLFSQGICAIPFFPFFFTKKKKWCSIFQTEQNNNRRELQLISIRLFSVNALL